MSERIVGSIKWYHEVKHFGFILRDDNNGEIFFHINDCERFNPIENLPVTFEIGQDRMNRTKAIKILPKKEFAYDGSRN